MKYCAVIAAAGAGARAGGQTPKQFAPLQGRSVLWYALRPFLRIPDIERICVVVADDAAAATAKKTLAFNFDDDNNDGENPRRRDFSTAEIGRRLAIVPCGGDTRALSVKNALAGVADDVWAIVHDAARPCLGVSALRRLMAASDSDGGFLAVPLIDSLKQCTDNRLRKTLARAGKWTAQTPQMFRAGALRHALGQFPSADDEAQAMQKAGASPMVVRGEARNIKITEVEDFALAAAILRARP